MSIATEMNYKNKEEAITGILKKYLVIKDNMLLSERLFVAKSVINWIFQNSKNPLIIKSHLEDVEKHINGELELSWKDGFIVRKKNKKETANENKKTEPKEKK
jgi:hypothetical protein